MTSHRNSSLLKKTGMGTLVITIFFLLLPTLIICFLAILEEKRKKQIKKDLKQAIGQLAKENRLQVGEIYFFHRKAISMDRKNKKLVFVNHHKKVVGQFCIDLETLVFCRVVKVKDEYSKDVEKVFIEVKNKGTDQVSKLVFYDRYFDNIRAKAALIREAEYWRHKINRHRNSINLRYAFEYVL
jgi:hypothetical protein